MQRAGVVARAPHTRPHTCPHTRAHTCPHMRPRTRPHTRSSHAVLTPSSHAPSHAPSHASSPLTRVLTRAFAREHSAPGVRPAGSATTGAVHTSLYSNGVFLAANSVSDERDVLVGMAPDPAEILRVRRPPACAQAIAQSTLTREYVGGRGSADGSCAPQCAGGGGDRLHHRGAHVGDRGAARAPAGPCVRCCPPKNAAN